MRKGGALSGFPVRPIEHICVGQRTGMICGGTKTSERGTEPGEGRGVGRSNEGPREKMLCVKPGVAGASRRDAEGAPGLLSYT